MRCLSPSFPGPGRWIHGSYLYQEVSTRWAPERQASPQPGPTHIRGYYSGLSPTCSLLYSGWLFFGLLLLYIDSSPTSRAALGTAPRARYVTCEQRGAFGGLEAAPSMGFPDTASHHQGTRGAREVGATSLDLAVQAGAFEGARGELPAVAIFIQPAWRTAAWGPGRGMGAGGSSGTAASLGKAARGRARRVPPKLSPVL